MSQQESTLCRRTVLFSGRVQGVGFRYTTQIVAQSFEVTGTVRNLADGRVEMIAEGELPELTRFQAAVEEAMHGNIENAAASDSDATGEFRSFGIAF